MELRILARAGQRQPVSAQVAVAETTVALRREICVISGVLPVESAGKCFVRRRYKILFRIDLIEPVLTLIQRVNEHGAVLLGKQHGVKTLGCEVEADRHGRIVECAPRVSADDGITRCQALLHNGRFPYAEADDFAVGEGHFQYGRPVFRCLTALHGGLFQLIAQGVQVQRKGEIGLRLDASLACFLIHGSGRFRRPEGGNSAGLCRR